ncbi:MAG TPA: twin-arginine translocase subunit TatB [Chromatiales bacterium]|nr:twin-arginine translocase subunit TatB [Chromatiales bacterium]
MFDIGFWELVVLFGLGLIVLGPERLPRVAMQVGNWVGRARRMAHSLTTQIRSELDVDPTIDNRRSGAAHHRRPGVDELKTGARPQDSAGQPGTDS